MEELFFYNPWWKGKFEFEITYKRDAFRNIIENIEKTDRIVVVKGPRRVGKTTIIYQLISSLIERGTNPKTILYLSFDDPKLRKDFDKILDFYKIEILKSDIQSKKIYIFMDEVQFLENWQYSVKKYYDRKFPIKFIVSGSAATLIKKDSESLMGRTIEEIMLPFSFQEYFKYKTGEEPKTMEIKEFNILTIKKYEEKAKILFSEYLKRGGFPNIFDLDDRQIQTVLREDVIEKALYRDIVSIYDIKKPELLEKLFIYLVNSTAQPINTSNISKYLKFSRQYVSKYITYLKNAYFIITLRNYSKSAGKTARSTEKSYCIDPAIINTFLSGEFEHEAGHIFESIVARHFFGKNVYYWKNYHEVDFVLKSKTLIPIEVKYKNKYTDKDIKGILEFCRKFKTKTGILLTKDVFEKKVVGDIAIKLIPIWAFILLAKY